MSFKCNQEILCEAVHLKITQKASAYTTLHPYIRKLFLTVCDKNMSLSIMPKFGFIKNLAIKNKLRLIAVCGKVSAMYSGDMMDVFS